MPTPTQPKAHHPLLLVTQERYDGTTCELGINNGAGGIGMWLRTRGELKGPAASLTPEDGRKAGADLMLRAVELDGTILNVMAQRFYEGLPSALAARFPMTAKADIVAALHGMLKAASA